MEIYKWKWIPLGALGYMNNAVFERRKKTKKKQNKKRKEKKERKEKVNNIVIDVFIILIYLL